MFAELFAFFGMPGPVELLVVGAIFALTMLRVLPFWIIFQRVGYPGAVALLALIPIPLIDVLLLFFLAFADWPALRRPADSTPDS